MSLTPSLFRRELSTASAPADFRKTRDLTRNHVTNNEPIRGPLLAAR